ncbi:hypothetical protein, partial [Salmonella sp. SAL4432]|uniref:hypothetical protein n=1 Tax=Salmonella sp. SAL4432 TaxID=3159887 RepID=UPI00397B641C
GIGNLGGAANGPDATAYVAGTGHDHNSKAWISESDPNPHSQGAKSGMTRPACGFVSAAKRPSFPGLLELVRRSS